jgi:mono/diheme cytochrome c family protein
VAKLAGEACAMTYRTGSSLLGRSTAEGETEIDMTTRGARRAMGLVAVLLALGAGCGGDDDTGGGGDSSTAGGDLALGEAVYQDNCARCHGEDLRGTDEGPSHLSQVYEPGHHPDAAFEAAIAQGSTQHHWEFGDMPPVEGLDADEVAAVIAYVRSVQDAEGFEPYPPG